MLMACCGRSSRERLGEGRQARPARAGGLVRAPKGNPRTPRDVASARIAFRRCPDASCSCYLILSEWVLNVPGLHQPVYVAAGRERSLLTFFANICKSMALGGQINHPIGFYTGYGPLYRQGCVSRTTLKLSHSPHNLAHSSTCAIGTARPLWLGLVGLAWAVRLCSSACTAAQHSRSPP